MSDNQLRYDASIDMSVANNSHTMSINMVGRGKRVLDVGCATGYLAEFLAAERDCNVWALEPDPHSAAIAAARLGDRVTVGGTECLDQYPTGSFDVIVYADVLEHLVDPGKALRDSRRLLAAGGSVVAVVPNGAHGDVRLNLLAGHFNYRKTGLLDSTHLRFLTRHSIPKLFASSGYDITEMMSTQVALGATEIGIDINQFRPDVVATVRADPEHSAYQYVIRAQPLATGQIFRGASDWMDGSLVALWARAFSPAEPVALVLPVADDDVVVEEAVGVIEAQCAAAGVAVDDVADIELVRSAVDDVTWPLIDCGWSVTDLRQVALPNVEGLIA